MQWKKLGLIIEPEKSINWMSFYAGPSFVETTDNDIKIYVTGRDQNNISRIGIVELDKNDLTKINHISKKPLFTEGNIGYFDESGVSYPWIVKNNNSYFMYYVGWVSGGKSNFQNFLGLAVSKNNKLDFQRVKDVPILDRTHLEPIGTGSVCVIKENNTWKMWYTSFVKWEYKKEKNQHYYHIKYAESKNGIDWERKGVVAIDFKNDKEHTIGKPMVLHEDNIYKMWYSYRGGSDTYRIGYAESKNGIDWIRKDNEVGIDISEIGWDCEMIEYAYVFNFNNKKYMIYNGNGFGKTGLGLAVLENENV